MHDPKQSGCCGVFLAMICVREMCYYYGPMGLANGIKMPRCMLGKQAHLVRNETDWNSDGPGVDRGSTRNLQNDGLQEMGKGYANPLQYSTWIWTLLEDEPRSIVFDADRRWPGCCTQVDLLSGLS